MSVDHEALMAQEYERQRTANAQAILAALAGKAPRDVETTFTFTLDPTVKLDPGRGDSPVELTSITIAVARYNGDPEDNGDGFVRLGARGYQLKKDGTRDQRRGVQSVYLPSDLPIVAPLLLQAMMRSAPSVMGDVR
jgi:hypothetical protein